MAFGGAGYLGGGPLGAAAAALPFVTPPIARSIMFSKAAQQGLLNPALMQEPSLGLLTASRVLPVAGPSLIGP
jgi:hypothetical protein